MAKKGVPPQFVKKGKTAASDEMMNPCIAKCLKSGKSQATCAKACS